MATDSPYIKYMSLLLEERRANPDPAWEGCAPILAYIAEQTSSGRAMRITDLVQMICFGTGPTVHVKIQVLSERGLIEVVPSKSDARAKVLTVTSKGHAYFKDRSKLMKKAFE